MIRLRAFLFPPEKPGPVLEDLDVDRLLIYVALLLVAAMYAHVTWYI